LATLKKVAIGLVAVKRIVNDVQYAKEHVNSYGINDKTDATSL
jgi:hypothetical protein